MQFMQAAYTVATYIITSPVIMCMGRWVALWSACSAVLSIWTNIFRLRFGVGAKILLGKCLADL